MKHIGFKHQRESKQNSDKTTSVSRRLRILFIMFKIIVFFVITLFSRLYVRVGILLTCGKHLHDCIISLSEKVWAQKTRLTTSLFIEVPVPRQESERSCICVLEVSILSPSTMILIFDFGIVSYFFLG